MGSLFTHGVSFESFGLFSLIRSLLSHWVSFESWGLFSVNGSLRVKKSFLKARGFPLCGKKCVYIYVRVYMRVRVCECVFFCVRFFVGVRVCVGTALCTAFVARKMLR